MRRRKKKYSTHTSASYTYKLVFSLEFICLCPRQTASCKTSDYSFVGLLSMEAANDSDSLRCLWCSPGERNCDVLLCRCNDPLFESLPLWKTNREISIEIKILLAPPMDQLIHKTFSSFSSSVFEVPRAVLPLRTIFGAILFRRWNGKIANDIFMAELFRMCWALEWSHPENDVIQSKLFVCDSKTRTWLCLLYAVRTYISGLAKPSRV